jgi:hypothetical protein
VVGKHRSHLRNYFFVDQEVQKLDCRRVDENMFSDCVSYVEGFSHEAVNPRSTTADNGDVLGISVKYRVAGGKNFF